MIICRCLLSMDDTVVQTDETAPELEDIFEIPSRHAQVCHGETK